MDEATLKNAYDGMASTYAALYEDGSQASYFFQTRKARVLELLVHEHGGMLLDVGCGPGIMAAPCIAVGYEFFGVDLSQGMTAECVLRHAGNERAHFAIGRAQSLQFPSAFFDAVLCMGVLEYMSEADATRGLFEMARVLKPGGVLVLSCLNKHSPFWQLQRILHSGPAEHLLSIVGLAPTGLPVRLMTERQIRSTLCLTPLAVESVGYFAFDLIPSRIYNHFPQRSLRVSRTLEHLNHGRARRLGLAFLVAARKRWTS